MKVLIAMCVMATRSGAEWFVFDTALALQRAGHSVSVYAPIMGDMVDPLRAQCVACITDLTHMAEPPDLIIGHTRDETVACLARFLEVPAISICHDRTAAHGAPPLFARIRQYVAVDENCAERLSLEHGIARNAIAIVSNGVDLTRFRQRPALPAKPARAVIFSNYATDQEDTQTIRKVCAQSGIALDIIGDGVQRQSSAPEHILGEYDLVFAKARCALEAMATGCAVILYNENMGWGGMVSTNNLAQWKDWNFGRRLLTQPVTEDHIRLALQRYSADDAAQVCAYVREHLSLDATVRALAGLATQVIQQEPHRPRVEPSQEIRDFARYALQQILPHGATPAAMQLGRDAAQWDQLQTTVRQQQDAMQQRVAALEGQNLALLHSLSWRITAPLRWAARKLGLFP